MHIGTYLEDNIDLENILESPSNCEKAFTGLIVLYRLTLREGTPLPRGPRNGARWLSDGQIGVLIWTSNPCRDYMVGGRYTRLEVS